MFDRFMPGGACFRWLANVLTLHVVSDVSIALACFTIAPTLLFFIVRRRDLPYKWLFTGFGVFVAANGTTHVLAVWTTWHPDYWAEGYVKASTALFSILLAIAFAWLLPRALALRSARDLETLNLHLERASAETQATIDNLGDGVVVFDEHLETVRINRSGTEFLRIRAAFAAESEVVDVDGAPFARERWPAVMARATGVPQTNVLMGLGKGAAQRWLSVNATPVALGPGRTGGRIVVALRDVTEIKARETHQRDYAAQLRALHSIASMTTGFRLKQIEAALSFGIESLGIGRAFFSRIDISTSELVTECSVASAGDHVDDLPVGGRYPLLGTLVGRAIGGREVLTVMDFFAESKARGIENYAGGGAYIAVPIFVDDSPYGAIGFMGRTARTAPFTAENVEFVKLTGLLIAAAVARGLQSERLDALAFFDALTGLPNRVLLYDRLVQTILASQRRSERFAVLFLDLDGFKAINDRFGHAAGDAVLKTIAERLQETLRESDTVARLGGDEFVIVAARVATSADAKVFAERILAAARRPIHDGDRTYELTASVGISFYPSDGQDMKSLIEQADIALYRAKQAGKNRIRTTSDGASD